MQRARAKAVILLSVALMLANAECFARCLAQPADHSVPPCHSQSKTHMAAPQHDMQAVAAQTVTVAESEQYIPSLTEPLFASEYLPQPFASDTGPLPLRI